MEVSSIDLSHGKAFAAKVRSLLGISVVPRVLDDHASFWLLAAFSRSKLCLDVTNVGHILHSILGGDSSSFAVVEVEDGIFKFFVISKSVGLLIYKLRSFENEMFRVFFHLWNGKGVGLAR